MILLRQVACLTLPLVVTTAHVIVQPLANEDALEPSVRNEVDHALARAPAEGARTNVTNEPTTDIFGTNGLSRTALALHLISTQKADGRWYSGTNDVTTLATRLLRTL